MGFTFKEVHTSTYNVYLKEQPNIPMTPEIQDHYETIAGRHGSYLFPQPFGDRIISVTCVLLADSREERSKLTIDIANWLYSVERSTLRFDSYPNILFVGKIESQIDMTSAIATGEFTVTFRCEPFKYGATNEILKFKAANNSYKEFNANGTTDIMPIVTLTASYGQILNPTIIINGFTFLYKAAINNGNFITINTNDFTVVSGNTRDSLNTGALDLRDNSVINNVDGSFPILQGGVNTVRFSCANKASADIEISWLPTYI